MKFILSQDDLYELNKQLYYAEDNNKAPYEIITDFLKSKQPIEEIASGEVFASGELYETYAEVGAYNLGEELEKYNGKNIKIYVQIQN